VVQRLLPWRRVDQIIVIAFAVRHVPSRLPARPPVAFRVRFRARAL